MVREPGIGRCASKDAGPRKRWIWGVPCLLEKEMSVSEDVGSRRGWTRGGVPAKTLGPERGWLSPEGGGHEAVCQQGR